MAEQIQTSERQRELFIRKAIRVAASYLNRAKQLAEPPELIYAAGAMPVRLCSGSYTAYSIGNEYIPRDACPLVKAVLGFGKIRALPAFDNCALLVSPVTCDCKKKLAGAMEQVKRVVPLHIPLLKREDADTEVFLRELYRLISILERETGRRVSARVLA